MVEGVVALSIPLMARMSVYLGNVEGVDGRGIDELLKTDGIDKLTLRSLNRHSQFVLAV